MAPDEVDGTDEDMLGRVADDTLNEVGLVAETEGLSGFVVGLENETAGAAAAAADTEGVEVEDVIPPETVVKERSSTSTFLEVIVRRILWYLLSSCCLWSWSVLWAL